MNVLPFVMAILIILSYGMVASLQGRLSMHRNQKAYIALRGAEKRILRKSEREQFNALGGELVKVQNEPSAPEPKEQVQVVYPINPPCARLNLYPLIEQGCAANPALYETAAGLLRIFYQQGVFGEEKRFEYKLLNALITGAKAMMKENASLPLETISLKDTSLQKRYYTCLKGTKRYELSKKGYPPLVDYMKIEKSPSHICLFHCHPDMLTVFFGFKAAPKLYAELHGEGKKQFMALEAILQWAGDPQLLFVDQGVWDLIDFKKSTHGASSRQTLTAEEDGVLIRKDILLKKRV